MLPQPQPVSDLDSSSAASPCPWPEDLDLPDESNVSHTCTADSSSWGLPWTPVTVHAASASGSVDNPDNEGTDNKGDNKRLRGFVGSLEEVTAVIKRVEVLTSLTYVKDYERCLLGGSADKSNNTAKQRNVRFADPGGTLVPDQGVPFILRRRMLFACMFGRDKNASTKKKQKERRAELLMGDHPTKRHYKKITGSKKKGCTACIHVKEVTRFTDYKDCNTSWKKRKASEEIHLALLKGEPLATETRFYISLPSQEDHEKTHSVGEFTGFLNPLSRELRDRIQELVSHGVTSVKEMKRHLKIYVETSLFPNPEKRPASTDMAYYPTDKCLRNHIYASIVKLRYSKLDVENLHMQVEEWKKQYPDDNFQLIAPSSSPSPQEDDGEPVSCGSQFFFCHQTKFQRHLLQRYGNQLCLLDATYRTTRYAVPLFFIAVKTNHGFSVVGEFVVQQETTQAIELGLQTIKKWMKEDHKAWKPSFFMTDFSEREIQAIERTFPGCSTYLCDFHREQAWVRWIRASENGLTSSREKVLGMMRRCAHATDPSQYEKALATFKASEEWKSSSKLRNWFSKQWIPHFKRWVWAFRADRELQVNTNNGIERQNKIFKYDYLEQRKDLGISGMASVLVTDYLPSMKLRYIQNNVTCMEGIGRTYDEGIPQYLRGRPHSFISHCMKKMELALNIEEEDVIKISESHYQVKSETSWQEGMYDVHLSTEKDIPSCQCHDWKWSRLPCKHMFAIFQHNKGHWIDFPRAYRESPFFTVDTEVQGFLQETSSDVELEWRDIDDEVAPSEHHDLPVRCQLSSKKAVALQVREHLAVLRDLSYACNDMAILVAMEDKLSLLVATTHLRMQNDIGLVEVPQAPKKCRKRKQPSVMCEQDTCTKLPARKKKKSTRVGAAADKKRESSRLITDYLAGQESTKVPASGVASGSTSLNGESTKVSSSCVATGSTSLNVEDAQKLITQINLPKRSLPKAKGMRYHVSGDVLEHRDFKSLIHPNWLNDKVINAYLHLLMTENNKSNICHIFIIPSYVAVQLNCKGMQPWMFKKVMLSKFTWIFMPINVRQSHWILLVAHIPSRTVSILDSMGSRDNEDILAMFRLYMADRARCTGELNVKWEFDNVLTSGQQSDGSSCGPFVLLNALALSMNVSPAHMSQANAKTMRNYVLVKLLQAAKKPHEQKVVCDMVGCRRPKQPVPWISCDVCGRWCHYPCVEIHVAPEGDYTCPICVAQYE